MAALTKVPVARVNPAQGSTLVPLFQAGGKWRTSSNFRFYRGVAFAVPRKAVYIAPSATAQTVTTFTPTCLINN